jgi:osmotically-inducible protein OsmY
MKTTNKLASLLTAALMVAAPAVYASTQTPAQTPAENSLDTKVRHELRMLAYYSVFDDISFRVDQGKVTLFGEVTTPFLKDDAGNAIKRLEGVRSVDNELEVLPLSRFDDGIRLRTYRAIYGYGPLQRYAVDANPSIHIIVKNGNVTLAGVVNSKADRDMAYMRARTVPGAFTVNNDLRVEKD